jgi:hypothetical protein
MINHHLSILVDQLRAEGIADPLAQRFTLAALWDDLATIADETPPTCVIAHLSDATPADIRARAGDFNRAPRPQGSARAPDQIMEAF